MFRCLLLILLLFVPCLPLSAQDARAPTWQAGLARVSITPTHLMWMSGYGARDKPAEGRVHDLWAKALVLQDAKGQRCVLVSLDLVGIDRVLAEEICADIRQTHRHRPGRHHAGRVAHPLRAGRRPKPPIHVSSARRQATPVDRGLLQ